MNIDLDFKNVVAEIREKSKVPYLDFLDKIEVIAFMGKMASGKDTLANFLSEKFGHVQTSFGNWLKHYAHKMTGIPKEPKPQHLYQWFGQNCRKEYEDIWIDCLICNLYRQYEFGNRKFVITDLRQPNERLFCFQYDFPVIKIECDVVKRMERIKARGVEPTYDLLNHETEKWIDILAYDALIDNSQPLTESQEDLIWTYHAIKIGAHLLL
ncbi:hypothetical protein H1164_08410 [Thermoactinomyces daqus]|uniref:Deoxynucleoside monophosphate kinase n=1 Tax=Thermoactinomyces daqus TaxID=1329516 RepID=A0A7W2AII6_9BACL|nr:AAA family ATPase [Thermoactinomyces daqus]MBA4542923.1 hypothetical protein [Thermoactinomyces daqus]